MVSMHGFGFFSDFALIYQWAQRLWSGEYTGLYPYPLMVLFAPVTLLPIDVAAALWLATILVIFVVSLKRESLYWIFFVPALQLLYLGQLDPLFWLAWRARRPALWSLLTLKPQLLPLALPQILSSKRNALEFTAATLALHLPFLILRPSWPTEWVAYLSKYGNRLTIVPLATVTAPIILSWLVFPFAVCLLLLYVSRHANLTGILFLANPVFVPYNYFLLAGAVSRIAIPLSWLAAWAGWEVKAGWPYAIMLLATLAFETARGRPRPLLGRPVIPPGKGHF
ncbi:MAG TPA: hypothetical protein VIU39_01610 [Anaerolineales bacterium]